MASSSSDLFTTNNDAVTIVMAHQETTPTIDSLEFVLCKNGEANDNHVLPLVHAPSFDANLAEILLDKDNKDSFQTFINNVCKMFNILTRDKKPGEEKNDLVSLTSVVVALPGTPTPSQDDRDGHGVTSAEFVPFYNNGKKKKRVLAVTYSEGKLQYDLMSLPDNTSSRGLTCLGRSASVGSPGSLPDYIRISLGISYNEAETLVSALKNIFGEDSCSLDGRGYATQNIDLSLEAIFTYFPRILRCIDEQLGNPCILRAYRAYDAGQAPIFEQVKRTMNQTLATYKLSTSSDATEYSLMRMFGCQEALTRARFQKGSDYVGREMDVAFFLPVPEEAARRLVVNLNNRFPSVFPYARFISAESRLSDMDGITFCEIAIDGGFLCRPDYQKLLLETLDNMAESEPRLMELLQEASGTRPRQQTPAVHASSMTSPDSSEKQQNLAKSLRFFLDADPSQSARILELFESKPGARFG